MGHMTPCALPHAIGRCGDAWSAPWEGSALDGIRFDTTQKLQHLFSVKEQ